MSDTQQILASQVEILYAWKDKFFLSADDADEYFDQIGEEGYNGIPDQTDEFTEDQIPNSGRIWIDEAGIYPNRSSAEFFDFAELVQVEIVR